MSRLVLTNATLLDGEHAPQADATVVVDGERIARVAVGHPVETQPDDRVVDVGGRTVMPGMATCHFHSTYHEIGSKPAPFGLEDPPSLMALWGAHNFRLALESGFTMAVSAGAAHAIDAAVKAAIEEGLMQGPRIMTGSRDVSTTGHSNDVATFPTYWDVRAIGSMRIADGADEFRRAVRYEIKDGAEMIKLFVTGGHGVPGPKEAVELTRDELSAAIQAAHMRGAKIRGHIADRDVMLFAIEQGIDLVDHGDGMDAEAIERMVEAGTFHVPSVLFPFQLCEKNAAAKDMLGSDIEEMLKILPEANDAGVKILLGDDWGAMGFAHGRYAEEIEFYVREAGISPVDVIRWATKHGAEIMGMADDLGTITEGKLADILVVDGDVVGDVKILQDRTRFLAILKGGEAVVDRLDSLAAPAT
jgi:imidazolonepropionase-like amidohydrolase